MALAYSRAYSLTRLFPSAVLNSNVLIRARPRLLLIASGLENTFISEHKMTTLLDDFINPVSQIDGLITVTLVQLILLLWHIFCLDLLEPVAFELKYLAVIHRLDHAIRKLPMEQSSSL